MIRNNYSWNGLECNNVVSFLAHPKMKMKQMLNKKILQKIIKRNKIKYVNGIDILHISLTGMTLQICQQYGLVQTPQEIPPKSPKITNNNMKYFLSFSNYFKHKRRIYCSPANRRKSLKSLSS